MSDYPTPDEVTVAFDAATEALDNLAGLLRSYRQGGQYRSLPTLGQIVSNAQSCLAVVTEDRDEFLRVVK